MSDFGDPNQDEQLFPRAIAVDSPGNIWGIGSQGNLPVRTVLFNVDPNSGNRTVIESNLGGTCAPGRVFSGLAVEASGNILLISQNGRGQDPGLLFSFNPTSGVCTKVTDFADRAQGQLGERTVEVAVTPAPATQPVDLSIANMEITQAIQNFANDVPLVKDKTAYVRVYPAADVEDRRVGARLRGFRDGVELPGSPLRPLYPLATAHTTGASRGTLNDSFNFWVPPEWRSGTVTFQAEINFGGAVSSVLRASGRYPKSEFFIKIHRSRNCRGARPHPFLNSAPTSCRMTVQRFSVPCSCAAPSAPESYVQRDPRFAQWG